ncbi:MAG: pyrroline-5-carboxylate reductase family protein, partial [Lysobacteraceae bacterium]
MRGPTPEDLDPMAPNVPALPPVAFIGGGNMARALIGGMVRGGTPAAAIHVSEPYAPNREGLAAEFGVATTEDN